MQKSVVDGQIAEPEDTLLIMDKYEKALELAGNNLSQEGKELEYYGKTTYYLDMRNQETYEINKTKGSITEKQIELGNLKEEIKQLETELDSLNQHVSDNEEISASSLFGVYYII